MSAVRDSAIDAWSPPPKGRRCVQPADRNLCPNPCVTETLACVWGTQWRVLGFGCCFQCCLQTGGEQSGLSLGGPVNQGPYKCVGPVSSQPACPSRQAVHSDSGQRAGVLLAPRVCLSKEKTRVQMKFVYLMCAFYCGAARAGTAPATRHPPLLIWLRRRGDGLEKVKLSSGRLGLVRVSAPSAPRRLRRSRSGGICFLGRGTVWPARCSGASPP